MQKLVLVSSFHDEINTFKFEAKNKRKPRRKKSSLIKADRQTNTTNPIHESEIDKTKRDTEN